MTTNDVLALVAEYLNGNEAAARPLADMFEEANMLEVAKGLREKNVELYVMVVDCLADLHGLSKEAAEDEIITASKKYTFKTKIEKLAAEKILHNIETNSLPEISVYSADTGAGVASQAIAAYMSIYGDMTEETDEIHEFNVQKLKEGGVTLEHFKKFVTERLSNIPKISNETLDAIAAHALEQPTRDKPKEQTNDNKD